MTSLSHLNKAVARSETATVTFAEVFGDECEHQRSLAWLLT